MPSSPPRPAVTSPETEALRNYVDGVKADVEQNAADIAAISPASNSVVTAADHGLAAWSFDPMLGTTAGTLASGTLYIEKCKAATAQTAASMVVPCTTAGDGLTLVKFAIFDSAGAQLAVTADSSASFGTSGDKRVAFSAASRELVPGETLYLAALAVGTTGPAIRSSAAASSLTLNLTASSGYRAGTLASQTDMPSTLTLSDLSPTGTRRLLGVIPA